jgi:RNA polymerase sigma-70 factor (ECF subfamily)
LTALGSASNRLFCLVPADLGDAIRASLEAHFAGVAGVVVLRENRRRERRAHVRRVRVRPVGGAEERRRVLNPNGRRVDDRRRALAARPRMPLPRGVGPSADRVEFAAPSASDDKRLAVAESLRLVVHFQLGETDAFRAIYERHFDGVYGYLLTALHDRHDAEDGAQEVFMRALRGLSRYEFRGRPFEAWLFRIARNHALNVKRRLPPVRPADPAMIDVWRDQRDLRGLMADMRSSGADPDLLVFIERLPASQRQVLVLRYMVGLGWSDVAEVLNRSSGAVRQLEQRALTYLRKRLEAVERGQSPRTRPLPMRRRAWPSPVAASRRGALRQGIRAA